MVSHVENHYNEQNKTGSTKYEHIRERFGNECEQMTDTNQLIEWNTWNSWSLKMNCGKCITLITLRVGQANHGKREWCCHIGEYRAHWFQIPRRERLEVKEILVACVFQSHTNYWISTGSVWTKSQIVLFSGRRGRGADSGFNKSKPFLILFRNHSTIAHDKTVFEI